MITDLTIPYRHTYFFGKTKQGIVLKGEGMNVVERAREIILKPKETWEKIREETTTIRDLYYAYAALLALIPAASNFIGISLIGTPSLRFPVTTGLVYAVLQYILTLAGMYVVAFIINALGQSFDSKKDMVAATKVSVYSCTPSLVAGILGMIPSLSVLVILASLYGLYLFYIGLPVLMETPKEKTFGYFTVVIVATLGVWFAIGTIAVMAVRIPAAMP